MQIESLTHVAVPCPSAHAELPVADAVHQQVTELAGLHIVPDNHTVTQVIPCALQEQTHFLLYQAVKGLCYHACHHEPVQSPA